MAVFLFFLFCISIFSSFAFFHLQLHRSRTHCRPTRWLSSSSTASSLPPSASMSGSGCIAGGVNSFNWIGLERLLELKYPLLLGGEQAWTLKYPGGIWTLKYPGGAFVVVVADFHGARPILDKSCQVKIITDLVSNILWGQKSYQELEEIHCHPVVTLPVAKPNRCQLSSLLVTFKQLINEADGLQQTTNNKQQTTNNNWNN